MTAAVESMAWTNQRPWHGLGTEVKDTLTPLQMVKAAEIDWTVSKREMFLEDGVKVPNKYALCRDSDNQFLSVVGETWKPVQNVDAIDFFTKFVHEGSMTMETVGSLYTGRYIWGLARVKDFTLGKADEIMCFLLLFQPHIHGKAMVIQFTPVRVVCWNTLNLALGAGLKGGESAFRMPHSREFNDEVKLAAEDALGLATEQVDEFQAAAKHLVAKKAKPEVVEEYFCEVLKFDPEKANKKKDGEVREPRMLPKFRAALEYAPGMDMPTAKGTMWGALNAVTYIVDHETGRERDTALRNAWLGHTAAIKRRAFDLALKVA